MTLPDNRPDTSPTLSASAQSDEASRRRRAIYQSLQPALPPEDLHKALALCEREFPLDQPFSVSEFCQRLAESSSEIRLSKEARLTLLRTMRQRAETLGIDPLSVQEAGRDAVPSETFAAEAKSGSHSEEQSDPQHQSDEDETVELLRPELESLNSLTDQVAYCTTTGRPYDGDRPSPELFALRYANFGQSIMPLTQGASGEPVSEIPSPLDDEVEGDLGP